MATEQMPLDRAGEVIADANRQIGVALAKLWEVDEFSVDHAKLQVDHYYDDGGVIWRLMIDLRESGIHPDDGKNTADAVERALRPLLRGLGVAEVMVERDPDHEYVSLDDDEAG